MIGQRPLKVAERRGKVLTGETPAGTDLERIVTLTTVDEMWSDYLAAVSELRAGTIWLSLGGAEPFGDYVRRIHAMFQEFEAALDAEVAIRITQAETRAGDPRRRGATWTYLTTDEPFGTMTERALRGLARRLARAAPVRWWRVRGSAGSPARSKSAY